MERYYFANWKENKTLDEARAYFSQLKESLSGRDLRPRQVIIFPPVVFLPLLAQETERLEGVQLGVQDVSAFLEGSHTGEVSVRQVSSFARFALVGHSERRREAGETPEVVNSKILACREGGVTPLICVGGASELQSLVLPSGLSPIFLAYEPPDFIGGEKTESPARIESFYNLTGQFMSGRTFIFIYGGSVNEKNVSAIFQSPGVSGVLIGHVSLDAQRLARIILA